MDVIKALRYLNSTDGPHISIEKLGIYCGIPKGTMQSYIAGTRHPPEEKRRQLEKGITELIQEINAEWPI